jgi:hypothetical protein
MEKAPNGNFSVDGELRFSSGNSRDNSSPHHADGTATTPSIPLLFSDLSSSSQVLNFIVNKATL